MQRLVPILILANCVLMISCKRPALPPINDAKVLHDDCVTLFKNTPLPAVQTNSHPGTLGSSFQSIPEVQWPASVSSLHPGFVGKNVAGILIFIDKNRGIRPAENGYIAVGYFALINPSQMPPPSSPSPARSIEIGDLGFIFKDTEFKNIYRVELPTQSL